jgi:type I restriction enzyme S subunit
MKNPKKDIPLSDICFFQEGPGIRKYEYQEGGYPIINVRCVQDGYIDLSDSKAVGYEIAEGKWKHFQVEEGDILFTTSGTIGRVAKVERKNLPLLMNTSVVRFRSLNTNILSNEYLYWHLKSPKFIGELKSYSTGSAQQNVGPSHLNKMGLHVPSLDEQRRIVARLERDLGKIKEAKRLRAEALAATESLLPAELHKIFAEGKAKGWEEKELGEVSSVVTGSTPKTKIKEFYGEEYLWACPGDLNESIVSVTGKRLSEYGFKKGGIREVPRGSVMMCCIGTIGKIGIASDEMATNQQINSFVPNTKEIHEKFLFYALMYVRKEFIHNASSTTLKIINKSKCEKIKISVPPLAEQKKIVARVDALAERVATLRARQEASLAELEKLEKSILAKAFFVV